MLSSSWNNIVSSHKLDVYEFRPYPLEFTFDYSIHCLNIFDFSFYSQYAQQNSFNIVSLLSKVQMQPFLHWKITQLDHYRKQFYSVRIAFLQQAETHVLHSWSLPSWGLQNVKVGFLYLYISHDIDILPLFAEPSFRKT